MTNPASQPNQYLLSISIGPVQDFIAASRKARDLWCGSALLSELARCAACFLESTGQVVLIFPPLSSQTQLCKDSPKLDTAQSNVANKLLVHVRDGDPADLVRKAKKRVVDRLEELWRDCRPHGPFDEPWFQFVVDESLLKEQLTEFVEWYAAWLSFNPNAPASDENSYQNRRPEVELLLAGRKALRTFTPAPKIPGRPKSSLDPARESVIRHDIVSTLNRDQQIRIHRALRVKRNEQLDGVSLLKRLGGVNRLVSVSRVAIDPFLRRAEADGHRQSVSHLKDVARQLRRTDLSEEFNTAGRELKHYAAFPYDCQLFYAQSSNEVDTTELDHEEIDAVDRFCSTVRQLRGTLAASPPAYFAVLVADGDRMGKALGTLANADHHRTFSKGLTGFADKAGETVRRYHGAMVYSGGDDVLAFLPLDSVLPCAYVLQEDFSNTIADIWDALGPDVPLPNPAPTLSVGVAIGHYADHLQVLLDRGRDAERAAKKLRNALSVSFTAHSGGGDTRTVTHSWNSQPIQKRWWFAINALRLDQIPDGAVYELNLLLRELAPIAAGSQSQRLQDTDLIFKEVMRILRRKRVRGGQEPMAPWVIQASAERLHGKSPADQLRELRMMIDELFIARKLLPVVVLGGAGNYQDWIDVGVELVPSIAGDIDSETPGETT